MAEAIVKDANLVVDQKAFTEIISSLNAINTSIKSMGSVAQKQTEKLEDIEEEQEKTSGGIGSFLVNFLRGQKAQKQSDGILKKTFGGVMSVYKGLKKGILGTILASLALLGIAWVLDYLQKLDLKQLREDIEKLVDEWYPKIEKYLKGIKTKWDQAVEDFNDFFGIDVVNWLRTVTFTAFALPRLYGIGKGVIWFIGAIGRGFTTVSNWLKTTSERIKLFFDKPPKLKWEGIKDFGKAAVNLVKSTFQALIDSMVELGKRGNKKMMQMLGLDENGVTRQRMRQMIRRVGVLARNAMWAVRSWLTSTAGKIVDVGSDLYKAIVTPMQLMWRGARLKLIALGTSGIRVTRDSWSSFMTSVDEIAKIQKAKWVTLADDLGKMGMTQAFKDWKVSFDNQMTRIRQFVHNPFKGRLGFIDDIVKTIQSIGTGGAASTQAAGDLAKLQAQAKAGNVLARKRLAELQKAQRGEDFASMFRPITESLKTFKSSIMPMINDVKLGITSIFGGTFTATGWVVGGAGKGLYTIAATALRPLGTVLSILGKPFFTALFVAIDGIVGAVNADELLKKASTDITMTDRIAGAFGGIFGGFLRMGEMLYEFFGGRETDYADVMTGRIARLFSVLFGDDDLEWANLLDFEGMANDISRLGVFFESFILDFQRLFLGMKDTIMNLPGAGLFFSEEEQKSATKDFKNITKRRDAYYAMTDTASEAKSYLSNMTKKSFDANRLVDLFQNMYNQEVTAFGGTEDAKKRAAFNIRQLFKNAMEDTALTQGQRVQLWNQMANNMSQVNTNISKQESYVALGMSATNAREAIFEYRLSNPFGI